MIVKVQDVLLPEASVARKPTTFTPSGNEEPLGRPRICSGLAEPEQLSGATGHINMATAVQVFGSVLSVTLGGQVMTGGVTSTTYTSITQVAVAPVLSVAVKVTKVWPKPISVPDTGDCDTVTPVPVVVANPVKLGNAT